MDFEKGFLINKNGKIKVNIRKTLSIIQNEFLLTLIKSQSKFFKGILLDVGCGNRSYSLLYDQSVEKSYGIDIPESPHNTPADVIAGGENIPFKDKYFDTVLCTEVLEHVLDSDKVLSEIHRVLKEDSYLIVSIPFLYPVHEPPFDHIRFTYFGLLNSLKKNGFEPIFVKSRLGVFTSLFSLFQTLAIGLTYQIGKKLFKKNVLEFKIIRYFFAFPQYMYLVFLKIFLGNDFGLTKSGVSKYEQLLSIGYFCVAKKH